MWWRGVPGRAFAVGSVLLVGRLVLTRLVRRARTQGVAPQASSVEEFQDTVPTVWSYTQDQNT
jgi:hypothetical protein